MEHDWFTGEVVVIPRCRACGLAKVVHDMRIAEGRGPDHCVPIPGWWPLVAVPGGEGSGRE